MPLAVEPPVTREDLHKAWERVYENAGCAGSDGVSVFDFQKRIDRNVDNLLDALANGVYRPWPLLRIVVQKKPGSTKLRTLLVPTVRDRLLQTAMARQLSRSFEDEFLECSFGYRPGRSVDRAIARIRKLHELGYRYVVDADIHSFFDEVPHKPLLERLRAAAFDSGLQGNNPNNRSTLDPEDTITWTLLESWVRAEVWTGERIEKLRKGVPQGSPISPLLANFFLEDFDRDLESQGAKLVRYADDFLILSRTPEEAQAQLAHTREQLEQVHLRLAVEKTRITSFEEGFRFLGAFFQNDSIWIPWKASQQQRKGKVLFVAKPLPAALREPYNAPLPRPRSRPPAAAAATGSSTRMRQIDSDAARRASAFIAAAHGGAIGGTLPSSSAAQPPQQRRDTRSMPFLYLTDQGSILRKAGDRFLIEREDEVILDLPYHKLNTVVVFGNVQVTTQALGELLEKGIPLHFLSRLGEYKGSLLPPRGAQVLLRLKQFEAYHRNTLPWAREFVASKLANAVTVLNGLRSRHDPDRLGEEEGERQQPAANSPAVGPAFDQLRERVVAGARNAEQCMLPELPEAPAAAATTLDTLLGIEGAASKAYFEAFWRFNKSEFAWEGRRMHPPPDPLNSLLSLAYTLLTGELTGLLESSGLDPYLGFLHQIDYNRPSLALDLIEPFRYPLVDRMVLRLVNRKQFQMEDFQVAESNGAVHLKLPALKRFLAEYEQTLLGRNEPYPWRDVLRDEVRKFARSLRAEGSSDLVQSEAAEPGNDPDAPAAGGFRAFRYEGSE